MTDTTLDRPRAGAGRGELAAERVTQGQVIRSEWIKLRSLRSTVWTLIATTGFLIGFGVLFCWIGEAQMGGPGGTLNGDPLSLSLRGVYLSQLAIGVLGVLLITGEYATGMIRATISAVPRRLPVLWAKLGVFAVVAAVLSVAAAVIAFLGGQAILSVNHAGVSLGQPGVLRAVIGAGLYLAVVGLLGMALGFIVRSTAGAITVLFAILLVLPVLGEVLPVQWTVHVVPYLPANAGQAILHLQHGPLTLAPWTGLALFAGYAAVAIAVAAFLLRRRDA